MGQGQHLGFPKPSCARAGGQGGFTHQRSAILMGVVRQEVKRSAGRSGIMGSSSLASQAASWMQFFMEGGRGIWARGWLGLMAATCREQGGKGQEITQGELSGLPGALGDCDSTSHSFNSQLINSTQLLCPESV